MLPKNMFLYLIFVLKILLILQSQTHRTSPGGATLTMYRPHHHMQITHNLNTTANNCHH